VAREGVSQRTAGAARETLAPRPQRQQQHTRQRRHFRKRGAQQAGSEIPRTCRARSPPSAAPGSGKPPGESVTWVHPQTLAASSAASARVPQSAHPRTPAHNNARETPALTHLRQHTAVQDALAESSDSRLPRLVVAHQHL
jgi:hypothetical protein